MLYVFESQNAPILFKGLNSLLLMFIVYGFFLIIAGKDLYITEGLTRKVRNFVYLKDILASLLPIYSFYYFTNKGYLSQKTFKRWALIFLLVIIAQYFRAQQENLSALLSRGIDSDETTNNVGYVFLSFFPCIVLFNDKKMMQYTLLSICMVFILLAMKRGAILICVIAIIYFLWKSFKYSSRHTKLKVFMAIICLSVFGYFAVQFMLETSDYFNARLNATLEGRDGNRSVMYRTLWETFWNDASFLQVLFGRGAWGTLTVNMNFAHNDWLEILTNQGLLGICVFSYYWICFYKARRFRNIGEQESLCISIIFIIYFLKTIFSMSYSDMNIYVNSILGFSLANGFTRDKIYG